MAVSAALRDVYAALHGMLAAQDTYGNSRGLEGPLGGVLSKKNILKSNSLI